MQFFRKLEPVQNVAATGSFSLTTRTVLGNVVERLVLVLGGTSLTKAMLSNLVVKLNGKVIMGPVTAAQLNLQQVYKLINDQAAYLTIDFTEPVARSIQGQLMGAIDTNASAVNDFTIEGTITGATAPTLEIWAQMRSPESMSPARGFDPATRPLIRALIPTTISFSAGGEFQNDVNYGSQGDSLIKRLFIHSTVVTGFRAKRNSLDIIGDSQVPAALIGFIEADYGRDDQTNLYVYDPLMDGNQSDAIPTRDVVGNVAREANFQWLFTVSGTGTATVFTDVYTTLAKL